MVNVLGSNGATVGLAQTTERFLVQHQGTQSLPVATVAASVC